MNTNLSGQRRKTLWSGLGIIIFAFFALLSVKPAIAQTGEMLNFDGDTSYVDLSSNVLPTSYTKEAWIRIPINDHKDHNIISGSKTALYIHHNLNVLAAGNIGDGFYAVRDVDSLVVNTWYHVAVTFDSTSRWMKLYKNGVIVDSAITTSTTDDRSYIGALYYSGITALFHGDIDEVRLWSVARTPEEIKDNYQCIIDKNTPGLLAYYDFNQGVAGGSNTAITSLVDQTPNSYDGALIKFALTGSTNNFLSPGAGISSPCTVTPVSLTTFTAVANDHNVTLNWQTASEINNAGFSIEHSTDGSSGWESIAFVNGAGTSGSNNNYSFTDLSPKEGVNYYRLNQQDLDGRHVYSPVAAADFSAIQSALTLYPTLAHGSVTLTLANRDLLNTRIMILDEQGKLVNKVLISQMKQTINISQLQNGLYFLKTRDGKSVKFIKQ